MRVSERFVTSGATPLSCIAGKAARAMAGRLLVAALAVTAMLGLLASQASAAPADDFVITVQTDNPGASAATEFTIPTDPAFTYAYDVDWGDGNTDTAVAGDITHTYATAGTYTIRISGLFPAIRFDGGGDAEKLLTVDQWGTNPWRSFNGAFRGASNLTLPATDFPDLGNVFSMVSAFQNASLVNSNLDGWDTSNVTSFSSTFEGATAFDLDIGSWDVSSATNMRSMFRGTSFNQDISGWNVGNVTSMSSMFFGNTVFDQPIGAWGANTAKVTTFSNMFLGASSFNQPVGTWDTGAASNMQSMFRDASLFNQDISGWDVSNVTAMGLMFWRSSFDQPIGAWGAATSKVTVMSGMFQDAPFNQDLSTWDTSSVTQMSGTFRGATNFDQDLSTWDFSQVTVANFFLDDSGMEDVKYDALLNSLNGQTLQSGVEFGALGLNYCDGDAARANIEATYSWTFLGDEIECPPPAPTTAPDLQATSDTGPSDSDNATAQNTPTFDAECTLAGATIVLFSDNPAPGTEIGRHLCYEVGIEPVTAAPALADGAHTISYLNENRKGPSGLSPSLAITIDASSAVFNAIQLENKNPGTDAWKLVNPGDDLIRQIKGYASETSVNLGDSIDFHISVGTAQNYTIDVYRMGWYQGWGGRLMTTVGPLAGTPQTYTGPDATFGTIEFDWPVSHSLTVPTTWTSGVYMAKLTNADGYDNYIPFAVRDDGRPAQLMYQQSVITDQAYNNFPGINPNDPGYDPNNPTHQGKSFYDGQSLGADTLVGGPRAVKISFDRPYSRDGAGLFFSWEHDQVKWLEKMGYDMAYTTNLDTHQAGAAILDFEGFVSPGHDEYWTKEMFDAVESARDQGVDLAFFGANAVYSQVRLEAAADGDADRIVVSYRNNSLDPEPVFALKTNRFSELGRPEQELIGVMYDGYNGDLTTNTAFIPTNLEHWMYEGTGFVEGDSVPGIIGYEYDNLNPGFPLPENQSYDLLSSSPFIDNNAETVLANAAVYQAPSGAWVFATGTLSWSWGLARDGLADVRIERMTENYFDRVLNSNVDPTLIIGTVTAADGAAVAAASVDLFEQSETGNRGVFLGATDTAADGAYRFEAEPGCKVLTFEAPAGESFNGDRWLQVPTCVEAGETAIVDVALDGIVSGGASLGGTVTASDGSAVAGVNVDRFVANADGSRGQFVDNAATDAAGNYLFAAVIPQCYVVTFSAPAGETFNDSGWLNVGRCVEVDEAASDVNAVLDGAETSTARLGGAVTAGDGSPAPGVGVDLFEQAADGSRGSFLDNTQTDDAGLYSFDVEEGCYVTTFIASEGQTFNGNPWFQTSGCVVVDETLDTLNASFDPATEASLGGTVTIDDGSGAEGVLVTFYLAQADGNRGTYLGSAQTDDAGGYSFDVAGGCHWLIFVAPGGQRLVGGDQYLELFRCVVAGEAATDLDASLQPVD